MLVTGENEQALLEFRLRSQQLADTIKATLEEQAGFLDQLSSSFLTRHELLSRQDFRELVEKLLQRFPTIQAVEWAPYVSASERNWFELEAKRIFPGYTISELGEASGSQPKPIGKDAFPVFYIEPLADNVTALGLDLASDPTRLNAIDASISKGVVVATAPIRLVQERSQQLGMLLIQYVSGGPNGSGLVLIVLRMATFAKTLVRAAEPILDLRFADAEANVPFFIKSPNLVRRRTKRGSNLAVAITSYRRLQLLDTYRCTEDGKAGPYWRLEPWQRGC